MTDRLCSLDPLLQRVLDAAAAPAEAPLPGEEAALAAFRALTAPAPRRRFSHPARVAAASAFGAVVMASGVAAAANGSLPLLPHHAAPAATAAVADADGAGHASSGARRAEGRDGGAGASAHPTSSTPRGAAVATVAHQAPNRGPGTGPAVCAVASAGSCQAGTHGKATTGSAPARGRSGTSQGKKDAAPGKGAHGARAHQQPQPQAQPKGKAEGQDQARHAVHPAVHRHKPVTPGSSAGH